MRLRKPVRIESPKPPPCPKCGHDSLVILDLRATASGYAAHLTCTDCHITTHSWRPATPGSVTP